MELEACPFCGGQADEDCPTGAGSAGHRLIYCKTCFASICEDSTPSVVAAWNRRASRSPVVGAVGGEPTQAAMDVLAERERQKTVEGWTPEHDDEHGDNSMSIAAACYALWDAKGPQVATVKVASLWLWTGWSESWFKPKSRRRNLVRAAALLLAEIERLDRGIGVSTTGSPEGEVSHE